jgi:hypothetical protein
MPNSLFMRKILLLLTIFVAFFCKAQQKMVDSLRSEINKHAQKDTAWLRLSNKLSFAYRSVDPAKGLALADSNIAPPLAQICSIALRRAYLCY